jgi:hypothetical protein
MNTMREGREQFSTVKTFGKLLSDRTNENADDEWTWLHVWLFLTSQHKIIIGKSRPYG